MATNGKIEVLAIGDEARGPMKDQSEMRESVAGSSTDLAADRTRLAYDRNLLAWIRTAISLITFGFSIYKFFQLELARSQPRPERLIGPTHFALLMIVIGLVSLVLATLEHHQDLKALHAQHTVKRRPLATILAGLVALLGVMALLAVMFRQ